MWVNKEVGLADLGFEISTVNILEEEAAVDAFYTYCQHSHTDQGSAKGLAIPMGLRLWSLDMGMLLAVIHIYSGLHSALTHNANIY